MSKRPSERRIVAEEIARLRSKRRDHLIRLRAATGSVVESLERRRFMAATVAANWTWDPTPQTPDGGGTWSNISSVQLDHSDSTNGFVGPSGTPAATLTIPGTSVAGLLHVSYNIIAHDFFSSDDGSGTATPTYTVKITDGTHTNTVSANFSDTVPARKVNLDDPGNPPDDPLYVGAPLDFGNRGTNNVTITFSVSGLGSADGTSDSGPLWALDNVIVGPKPEAPTCDCQKQDLSTGAPAATGSGPVSTGFSGSLGGGIGWSGKGQMSLGGITNGNNAISDGQSFLVLEGPGTVIAVDNAVSTRWFDTTNSTSFTSRFGVTDSIVHDTGSHHEYIISASDGTQSHYYDFSTNVTSALQGTLKSVTDPNNNGTSYSYGGPNSSLSEMVRSSTTGTVTTKESFQYTYLGSPDVNAGKISSLTLYRKTFDTSTGGSDGSVSYAPVETSAYTYYGNSDSKGNLGDLKTDTLEDRTGTPTDTTYYRYYTSSSAPGYKGGLKLQLGPASYDRMVGDGLSPLTADDTALKPYADAYYEYNDQGQVTKKVIQGEGCSSCSAGLGIYQYSYASNPTGQTAAGTIDFNSWTNRTIETLPDNNQNVFYFNTSGATMLSVFQELAEAKSVSSVTHSSTSVTVNSTGHGFTAGNIVVIRGASVAAYNGIFTIATAATDSFTYTLATDPGSNPSGTITASKVLRQFGTFTMYDDQGRAVLTAQPSAVALPANVTTLETHIDLLNKVSGNYQYLNDSTGLINITDYGTSNVTPSSGSTSVGTTNGNVTGYVKDQQVKRGETGTPIMIEAWTYYGHTYAPSGSAAATVYLVASDTSYGNDSGSGSALDPRKTLHNYTFDLGSGSDYTTQVQSETVTQPLIIGDQNGPASDSSDTGKADTTTTFNDSYGRTIWSRDGGGFVTYTAYDPGTGAVIESITDVDYSKLSGTEQALFDATGWAHPSGGLNLVTTFTPDDQGRTTKMVDPKGNVTYTVYKDAGHEVRTYTGWTANGTNSTTTGPTIVHREDRAGSYSEDLTMKTPPSVTFSGTNAIPSGTESIAGIQTLSRTHTSKGGQTDESDRYFSLVSGTNAVTYAQGAGSFQLKVGTNVASSNFYAATFGYDDRGRQDYTKNALGTISRTIYDGMGRATSSYIGTNDQAGTNDADWSPSNQGSNSNMIKVSDNYFDTYDPQTLGAGDGNLTRSVQYPSGTVGVRVSEMFYDWRDRLVATKSGVLLDSSNRYSDAAGETNSANAIHRPIIYQTYDNLGEVTRTEQFDGDGISLTGTNHAALLTSGVPSSISSSARRARTTVSFDDQGRAFRTDQYDINQSGTSAGCYHTTNTLSSFSFYDHRGNVMAAVQPGGLAAKYVYDGAGRLTKQFITDAGIGVLSTAWKQWSNAASVLNDIVLSQTENRYDANGNVILTIKKDRADSYTDTGPLPGPAADLAEPQVVSRLLFYNNSVLDGYNTTSENGAIATDRQAVLPGHNAADSTGTMASISGYSKGINGVIVDIANLHGRTVTASDFSFKVGTDNDIAAWSTCTATATVSISAGGGIGGADRVYITFPSGSITNEWLQVTVKADANTGLSAPDVFFYGSTVGDANGDGFTDNSDQAIEGNHSGGTGVTSGPTLGDFNVDGTVNSSDLSIAMSGFGNETDAITPLAAARASTGAYYYDAANRLTDSVDVGTNGGFAYTRPTNAPTNSSNVLLLNHTTYNDAGWQDTSTDAKGIKALTLYDMLGRTTRTVAAWDGTTDETGTTPTVGTSINQVTDYSYDGNDNVVTQTAWNKSGTNAATFQSTAYIYGVTIATGSGINDFDLLRKVEYPDNSTGYAGTNAAHTVSFNVDALGEKTSMADRNGTVHAYGYDALGREVSDVITTFGSGVNEYIGTIKYSFDTAGRPFQQTTYRTTDGSVDTQLQDEYNGLGQLIQQFQAHGSAVDMDTTPSVQYVFNEMSDEANNSRLTAMIFPNGRIEHYVYGDGLDNAISRVSALADDDNSGGIGQHLEEYTYLGLGTIVEMTRPENSTKLSYIQQSGDTQYIADGGDQYTGLDRFNRVIDQWWFTTSSGTPSATLDRFQYGYDRNGNVLYQNNLGPGTAAASFSELFHANSTALGDNATAYDKLNRLTGFRRGVLSSSTNNAGVFDTVTTPYITAGLSGSQSWALDAQGNQASVTTDTSTVNRTADQQNQITSIDGASTPTYDANGNMLTDQSGNTFIYNAWNWMVFDTIASPGADEVTQQIYGYDAMGRRAGEAVVTASDVTSRDNYFSQGNQIIEERAATTLTTPDDPDYPEAGSTTWIVNGTVTQYVYGITYVNDLVLRDRDADLSENTGDFGKTASGLEERTYVQHDLNHNVTTLVNTGGSAVQRIAFDSYGNSVILDNNWAPESDGMGWLYRYQGMRWNVDTGLYVAGVRDYNTSLSVWQEEDPTGYVDGANLYGFVADNPVEGTDPFGFATTGPSTTQAARVPRLDSLDWVSHEKTPFSIGGVINQTFDKKEGGQIFHQDLRAKIDYFDASGKKVSTLEYNGADAVAISADGEMHDLQHQGNLAQIWALKLKEAGISCASYKMHFSASAHLTSALDLGFGRGNDTKYEAFQGGKDYGARNSFNEPAGHQINTDFIGTTYDAEGKATSSSPQSFITLADGRSVTGFRIPLGTSPSQSFGFEYDISGTMDADGGFTSTFSELKWFGIAGVKGAAKMNVAASGPQKFDRNLKPAK